MAEENKNLSAETTDAEVAVTSADTEKVVSTKKEKVAVERKPNIFVRAWKRIKKFFKDTFHEMKKVRWTPKNELVKSTVMVVVSVLAAALALGVVELIFTGLFDLIAALIG